jgi:hypothetical protein
MARSFKAEVFMDLKRIDRRFRLGLTEDLITGKIIAQKRNRSVSLLDEHTIFATARSLWLKALVPDFCWTKRKKIVFLNLDCETDLKRVERAELLKNAWDYEVICRSYSAAMTKAMKTEILLEILCFVLTSQKDFVKAEKIKEIKRFLEAPDD